MNSPTEAEFIDHWREMRPNVIDGFIKLKLVHAEGTSLLVPDLLAADFGGMCWFQPKFFYAPQLSFWEGYAAANIGIEVSGGPLVNVAFTSGGFVASLSDSSQVYRCMISAPGDLGRSGDGTCSLESNGDFRLDLFHHTTDQAAEAIQASGHWVMSAWNLLCIHSVLLWLSTISIVVNQRNQRLARHPHDTQLHHSPSRYALLSHDPSKNLIQICREVYSILTVGHIDSPHFLA